MADAPATNVYVDGFNLYYRRLRPLPDRPGAYRWLNPRAMAEFLLPGHQIQRVRYFTARITARPDDVSKPQRQQAYLRALETVPGLTIHEGEFFTNAVWLPLVDPPHYGPQVANVFRTEEKGSDVNLATHLLLDGFRDDYQVAVVVSNDSDLVEPIRVVREELGLTVGVITPNRRVARAALPADFTKRIPQKALALGQFPDELRGMDGRMIRKPDGW